MNTEMPKIKPLQERDSLDLLELVCQLHSRTFAYPHSKDLHNAYVDARNELEKRIKGKAPIEEAIPDGEER